jgi:diguanylate cyclase (GGDEF)-like protein
VRNTPKGQAISGALTSEPVSAARVGAVVSAGVQAIWQRRRPEVIARLASVEESVAAVLAGHLPDALRARALSDAHKLAGAAGTFGFPRSSMHARALEDALRARPGPAIGDAGWMAESVLAIRTELEGGAQSVTAGAAPREGRPLVLIASDDSDATDELVAEIASRDFLLRRVDLSDAAAEAAAQRPAAVLLDAPADARDATAGLVARVAAGPARPAVLVLTDGRTLADRVAVARAGGRGVLSRTLPARRIADALMQAVAQAHASRPRVLALDDDPAVLDVLRELLAEAGIAVATALTADAFWESLRGDPPDLVMLDVDMPEVDGVALCRVIRNEPGLAELPVLFLTARADAATVERVFAAGADDYVGKPIVGPVLLNRLRNRVDRMRLLRELAERDQLTGLTNRAKTELELERMLALAARGGDRLSIAVVDVDHFKRVNDHFGHASGDLVLRGVADVLRASFRSDDVVGRWGGEEFVVGMHSIGAARAVERLSEALERLREEGVPGAGAAGAGVTFSAGVAELGRHGDDLHAIYRCADRALYAAKAAGRDRVVAAGEARHSVGSFPVDAPSQAHVCAACGART